MDRIKTGEQLPDHGCGEGSEARELMGASRSGCRIVLRILEWRLYFAVR
jgi:hypothetical protein